MPQFAHAYIEEIPSIAVIHHVSNIKAHLFLLFLCLFLIHSAPPREPEQDPPIQNPCIPSPCGANSICRESPNGQAICTCNENMIGSPPSCRPQCTQNYDCGPNEACINQKCQNPCINACPSGSECRVQNHVAICECPPSYTGNAFEGCTRIIERPPVRDDPCDPNPCGRNAVCENGICRCSNELYKGDPYVECRPECTNNGECQWDKACVRYKCVNPCVNEHFCARNAICTVQNHIPNCQCPDGFTGDPFTQCRIYDEPKQPSNPCYPSPCGNNAQCREGPNNQPICSCLPNMLGSPPNCKPECITNSECDLSKACQNRRCVNPCDSGTCGINANCKVISHSPVCRCNQNYEGDPFTRCNPIREDEPISQNPCYPSPCGPNSICKEISGAPACSCVAEYVGVPPNCRPECVINQDCSTSLACMNRKCKDPCVGTCGENARCSVINHNPICTCIENYRGDPFYRCEEIRGIKTIILITKKSFKCVKTIFDLLKLRFMTLNRPNLLTKCCTSTLLHF